MRTTPSPSRSAVSTESASRAASGSGIAWPVSGSIGRPVGVARSALGRLGVADDVAVDDDLDRVALVLVERRRLGQVVLLAVDPDPHEALLAGRLEDPVALGLAVLDERPEDEQARPLRAGARTWSTICWTVWRSISWPYGAVRVADPGEQQPEVVVDLGDGADRRARVPDGALLVDRDRRARARRSGRRPASPSGRGTGGRTRSGSRRTGAGPRRRSCRRRGCSCRSRTAR